jgi:hypothetical protein
MTRIATHLQRKFVTFLAVAMCAVAVSLAIGTAKAGAATAYTFSTRTPYGAACNYGFGLTNYKVINAYPPTVYAKDASVQYVYWRAVVWNTATDQDVWVSAWSSPTLAYSTSPAQFTQGQQVTINGSLAFSTYAVETDVYWYSPTLGWHFASNPAEPMLVAGMGYSPALQPSC